MSEVQSIAAPVSGKILPLEEVADPTFASKVLGDGFAVEPETSEVKAPFDGTVQLVYDTGHAVGVISDSGKEVLIHIGIDTVSMKGEGFDVHVKEGQKVKKGDVLVEADLQKIQAAGKATTVMLIVTSGEEVKLLKKGEVRCGEEAGYC